MDPQRRVETKMVNQKMQVLPFLSSRRETSLRRMKNDSADHQLDDTVPDLP